MDMSQGPIVDLCSISLSEKKKIDQRQFDLDRLMRKAFSKFTNSAIDREGKLKSEVRTYSMSQPIPQRNGIILKAQHLL